MPHSRRCPSHNGWPCTCGFDPKRHRWSPLDGAGDGRPIVRAIAIGLVVFTCASLAGFSIGFGVGLGMRDPAAESATLELQRCESDLAALEEVLSGERPDEGDPR